MNTVKAQVAANDLAFIHSMEDTLITIGDTMIYSPVEASRFIASYRMIRGLKAILSVSNSYQYQFDSMLPIKVLYAPDNKFRIITWNVISDEQSYRYFGAIQMNTDTLTLFPLIDYSDYTEQPENKTLDNNNWYGCMYYDIIPVKKKKKGPIQFYTLLGADGSDIKSNKKVIDVLWFDEGQPRFGYPILSIDNKLQYRYVLEFAEEAWATLRFDKIENKIIYDHVEPKDENMAGFFPQYLPDGTYEGFELIKGIWHHINEIAYTKREDGDVPNYQKTKGKTLRYQGGK
ncbi:MAG: hypothetical protein H6553_12840 [Chitinophagales bacterium]|nr:hypothetical protein [Chitinophagales bacterium]